MTTDNRQLTTGATPLLALLIVIGVACRPAAPPVKPAAKKPQIRATVVTVRTTVQPENRTFERTLVLSGDRARDTGELDTWRLYDTKANTVTFVDDLQKTFRTEPLAGLVRKRTAALSEPLPAHYKAAKLVRTSERRPLQGVTAEQALISAGDYHRELWLAEHPSIPNGLFAMMVASEALSSPLAPMVRAADEALMAERGFPLADRTSVPIGEETVVIDRSVTGIAQRPVPQDTLAIPRGYRELTPKPAPGATK